MNEQTVQILLAIVALASPVVVVVVTHLITSRKIDKAQASLDNGLRSLTEELHQDMQFVVKPALQDVVQFRKGYEGTVWSDSDAINTWIETNDHKFDALEQAMATQAHTQISQFGMLSDQITDLRSALREHDQWEKRVKYGNASDD